MTDLALPAAPAAPLSGPAFVRRTVDVIPGVALLTAIGLTGKWIQDFTHSYTHSHHIRFPEIEYVLWAILIGVAIANLVRLPEIFKPGVATYEFFLKLGIVLLGARFLLGDLGKLGGTSLALAFIEIAVGLGVATALGRLFKLNGKLTSLLAIGSSICGVSAIIAGKGAIEADDEDAGFAITAILSLGAIALFSFPAIGHALSLSAHQFGLWSGLAVDNTAESTATGALFSADAGKVAVVAKSTRNATIGFIVLGYAAYWAARGQARKVENKAAFVWSKFPKFVLGFLAVSALATWHVFGKPEIASLGNLSKWAFLLTFAGVGLAIDVRALRRQGWRPFAVGFLTEIVVAVVTLGLVVAFTD